jgi:DNA-binding transcriptional LysR family regulator
MPEDGIPFHLIFVMSVICPGMPRNLRSLDLNLLTVFEAIYAEGNLGRAAQRLAMSQPAVSNALARLRVVTGDPLFVKSGRGVVPTPCARQLHAPVGNALDLIRSGLAGAREFNPRHSQREFVVATGYGLEVVAGPDFLAWAKASAPGVRISGRLIGHREAVWADLRDGVVDVTVDVVAPKANGFVSQHLIDADVVVVARKGHPRVRNPLTLEGYLAERHVVLRPKSEEEARLEVRRRLVELNRDVALEVSNTLALAVVVSECDLLGVLGRPLAERFAEKLRLRIFPPPLPLPAVGVYLAWHRSRTNDPGHRWLREGIAAFFERARSRLAA